MTLFRPPDRLALRLVEPEEVGLAVVASTPGFAAHPPENRAWMAGRVGGEPRPGWSDGSQGTWWSDETVWRLDHGWWWPGQGAVADDAGNVFRPTIGQARPTTPGAADLAPVPLAGTESAQGMPLQSGAVFMSFGGTFNYGHFLIDCLPSLVLLDEAGVLDERPSLRR